MISLGLGAAAARQPAPDPRPAEGLKNLWYSYRDSDRCVVFIHGLGDNCRDCWYDKKSNSYWPDRLSQSGAMLDCSVYLGGYYTDKIKSGDYGVSDCANQLYRALSVGAAGCKPVLAHKSIVFVCHSLGGIVARYMLESRREQFQDQAVGLFLFASPSTGSGWADAISYIADALNNDILRTLRTDSPLLEDLDKRFRDLINNRTIPRLFGKEACETRGYAILVPKIVGSDSAGRNFGAVEKLAETDHSSCVKPDTDSHVSHVALLSWIDEYEKRFAAFLPARRPVSLVCRRVQCSLRVANEDGDAENELAFVGISGTADAAYRILGARQGSGYASEPQLNPGRTDPSIQLASNEQGCFLRFTNSPTADAPVNAAFRLYNFNAFSMDASERRFKGGSQPGIDYFQKTINQESIQDLIMHVQAHPAMLLDGQPFAEVRKIGEEAVDDRESARATKMLDYSPLLRTITLFLREPLPGRSYRVCWRLGSPAAKPEPSGRDLFQCRSLVDTLLWLRRSYELADPDEAAEKGRELIGKAVGDCAGLVAQSLGTAEGKLAVKGLELSLMAVDGSDDEQRPPVVRMVAGSGIGKGSWQLELPVGEGNAGRAVKKGSVRFYDYQKAKQDPFRNIYLPVPGGKQHQWLMSVPLFSGVGLVYGVVNVGTFQKKPVLLLRELEQHAKELAEGFQVLISETLDLIRSKYGEVIDASQDQAEP